jgi:hypothetical protein
MEPSSIVLILAPILFPIAMKLGIDPVHFGILMVVNMEVGMCHPPVGLNLYVASGITKMGITELTVAVWPWLLTMLASWSSSPTGRHVAVAAAQLGMIGETRVRPVFRGVRAAGCGLEETDGPPWAGVPRADASDRGNTAAVAGAGPLPAVSTGVDPRCYLHRHRHSCPSLGIILKLCV